MIFQQQADDRKVRAFSLSQTFLEQFDGKQPDWGPIGYFTYKRCVVKETPVLCDDLVWRPAGALSVGQGIIGFDEERSGRSLRHLRRGVVMHNEVEKAQVMGVELDDGTVLYATPDHPWLVKLSTTDNRMYWKETKDLEHTHKNGAVHLIRPFGPVWAEDRTYEGRFLSAAFDGEGCFDRMNSLSFIQVDNGMLRQTEDFLFRRGVTFKKSFREVPEGRQVVFSLRINGRAKFLPLLGTLRPPRLLDVFRRNVDRLDGDLGALRCSSENYVRVVRVFEAGERDIAVLSTDIGTHFTGGFASHNTYARELSDGRTEEFWQTCQRVVEGCFNIQKIHCRQMGLPWIEQKAQRSAQDMFQRMWDFKFTPPGRGLWMMGTDLVFERGSASLQNCSFVSSENIAEDFAGPFTYLMDMSMLGVGVGGDTRGSGKAKIQTPRITDEPFVVEDSREGWVDLIKTVLNSFVGRGHYPTIIDYSGVRGWGVPIKTFGGIASGPKPLVKLVMDLTNFLLPEGMSASFRVDDEEDWARVLQSRAVIMGDGESYKITSAQIVDIFNYIGKAVVAGGIRRCLPEGTLVHTSGGLIPIEKVKIGNYVMTSSGLSRVTDWVSQGVQDISQVTTQMGVFEATGKHKIAVVSDIEGGYVWKQLRELGKGDRMVFVDRVIEGSNTELPPFKYNAPAHSTICKDIEIPTLTPEIAWLLGLIAGDGYVHLTNKSGQTSIAVAVGQEDVRDRAVAALRCFGVSATIIGPWPENQCYNVMVKSKQLALYLSQFKETLVVPDCVLSGNPTTRAAYVAGLADADGCFKNRPLVVAASVYPSYLEEVQSVLASLGIPSRMHKDKQRKKKGWKPLFQLTVVGSKALQSFKERISGFSSKYEETRKTDRSQNDYGFPSRMALEGGVSGHKNGKMQWSRESRQITVARLEGLTGKPVSLVPVEVRSVEHGVRKAETFDISVEAGEFVAQGGYLVHNTAEIMFGEPDDEEFLTLKQDKEALADRRWASNNSVLGSVGMDYGEICRSMAVNGEPGLFWVENARKYSRMGHAPDNKDWRAMGANPCSEQTLESWESCNLVETFPAHHDTYEDFERTLKMAYLYAKTVTLVPTHDPRANAVMIRNRRIGCSMSGIMQAMARFGRRQFFNWCDRGYSYVQKLDRIYSDWLGIPLSIKTTTVKPSGCQTPDTLVNTSAGIFRLDELGDVSGPQWQDIKRETTLGEQITQFYVNGSVPTKRVITEDGNELEGSLNHKYRVYENDEIVWREAQDLRVGDCLVVSLGDYTRTENAPLDPVDPPYHNTHPILQPSRMTPKLAWFLGVLYGDGSVHEKGLRISFDRKEASLVHFIHETVRELFGIDARVDNDHSIYLNSVHLLAYLEHNGILKQFSEDLTVPLAVRTSSRESIKAFITGVWRADGAVFNRSTWGLCTAPKPFVQGLLALCRAVGFNVKAKVAGPGGWGSQDRWLLASRFTDPHTLRYASCALKSRSLSEDLWLDPVLSIEDSESDTYDISVPATKEYVANGVVSHNTVSLLAGATPGIHYPHSEYYIRRIRIQSTSILIKACKDAGYQIEPDVCADDTMVVSFPVKENLFVKGKRDATVWEQFANAAAMQHYWADNQVSITVTFKPNEVDDLQACLEMFEDKLKGISVLPLGDKDHGYVQAPYEAITEDQYMEMTARIKPLDLSSGKHEITDAFCDGDKCTLPTS